MKLITRRGEPFEYHEAEDKLDLFSVSQVRKVAHDPYSTVAPEVLEAARVRGTYLHKRFFFCLASLKGLCAYPAVHPAYVGYCHSMDRWIDRVKPLPQQLEEKSLNRRYRFAGCIDARVLYRGADLTNMDLKSGAPTCTDKMQLAAYHHLEGFKADRHVDVYLDKDGGEAREVFVTRAELMREWAGFLNALSVLRWRMSHGV